MLRRRRDRAADVLRIDLFQRRRIRGLDIEALRVRGALATLT
jgi:hypothetical protein